MFRVLIFLFSLMTVASAQVLQSGNVTPGHVPAWATDNVLQDGGPATNGVITEIGITNTGLPFCINDAPISSSSGYHQFCLGSNVSNQGILSYQAYGGATAQPLIANINGVTFPLIFPFVNGLPQVSSNAGLKAVTVISSSIYRAGFNTAGDGGAATYSYSSSPCSLNSGAGDNGSQVQATGIGSGCWLADLTQGVTLEMFGGKGDGSTDNLAAFNAAKGAFTYAPFSTSGNVIKIGAGTYYTSAPLDMTGKTGLQIVGVGSLSSTVKSIGDYPVFKATDSIAVGGYGIAIKNLTVQCGGKGNANANGVQWAYTNAGRIEKNTFYSCNKAIDLTGQYLTFVSENNVTGTGAMQNNTCLQAEFPTDLADNFGDNSLIVRHNLCQFAAVSGARLIDANGSVFDHNYWISTVVGVDACNQPSTTYPSGHTAACEFMFFDQDQTDTTASYGWRFQQGSGVAVGPGILLQQPWAGSSVTAAFDISGANHISIVEAEIESTDIGFNVVNSTDTRISGRVFGYNARNSSSPAVLLNGSTGSRVNISTSTAYPISGTYNGISETGASSGNGLWAGPASCGIGLAFGGGTTGLTYSTGPSTVNQCQYEVDGMKVRVQFYVALSAVGSSTGPATLTGLPIKSAPAVSFGYGATGTLHAVSGFSGLTSGIISNVVPADTTVGLYQSTSTGDGAITNSNFTNSSLLVGSLDYFKQ